MVPDFCVVIERSFDSQIVYSFRSTTFALTQHNEGMYDVRRVSRPRLNNLVCLQFPIATACFGISGCHSPLCLQASHTYHSTRILEAMTNVAINQIGTWGILTPSPAQYHGVGGVTSNVTVI